MAISHKRQAQHHLKSAKQALRKGDAQTAQGHLAQADKIAASGIATHTHHANNGASAPQRQRHAKAANDLNSIRHTIKETIVAQNKFPTPFSAGMTQSCPPGARAGAMGIMDAGGYSNAGGLKQAPPGAGAYMRVPFLSTGGDLAANNGQPFGIVENGGQRNFIMRTPQLSWLQYRLRGIVIERQSNGAALNDIINFEDLRQEGGPNLIIGEGQLGVDSCRMGDSYLLGLRYNPVVTSPNQLELRIRSRPLLPMRPSLRTCRSVVERASSRRRERFRPSTTSTTTWIVVVVWPRTSASDTTRSCPARTPRRWSSRRVTRSRVA